MYQEQFIAQSHKVAGISRHIQTLLQPFDMFCELLQKK